MLINLFVSFALAAGLLILFQINPVREISFLSHEWHREKKISFKQAIGADKKRHNFIARWFIRTKEILEMTDRGEKYNFYCRLSVMLAVIGAAVALVQSNILLIPVLALTGMLFPLLVIQLTAQSYEKRLNRQIEIALSIINSSYFRTENILTAVHESLPGLNPPVSNLFSSFLYRVENVDPSVEHGIAEMRNKTQNPIFKQWCNAMILCQHDRTAKHMLEPIVEKLANIRTTQGTMETEMMNPIKLTIIMIAITVLNIPMVYFLNRSWFSVFNTFAGKVAMAFIAAAVLFALVKSVRAARPLEYQRRGTA